MKKLNVKGFTGLEALLIIVIIGLIGGVGFYVYNNQKSTKKTDSPSSNSAPKGSDQKASELEEYCEEIEKVCVSFDNTWEKQIEESVLDETNKKRKSLQLNHKTDTDLTIYFTPYVDGVGGACADGTIVGLSDISGAKNQKVVEAHSKIQDIRDGQPVGAPKYFVTMSVQSATGNKPALGYTDCLGLGIYRYSDRSYSGALSVRHNEQGYDSEQKAKDWFASEGAKAAKKVLQSLVIK